MNRGVRLSGPGWRRSMGAASCWMASILAAALSAQDQTAADSRGASLFGPTTIAYLEIAQPAQWLDELLNHPLRTKIESFDPVKQFLGSPQGLAAQSAVSLLEGQLEMSWREAVQAVTRHGVHLGIDSATQGVLIIAQSQDGPTLSKVVRAILGWVELAARNQSQAAPFQMVDYRGHRIARFEGFALGRVDEWLVASTQWPLIQQAMDRLIDRSAGGWTDSPLWRQAVRQRLPSSDVWAVADLESLRRFGLAPELFSGRSDNALAELLVGGLLDGLSHAPWLTAALDVQSAHLEVRLDLAHEASRRSPAREYFFAADPPDKPTRWVRVPDMIGHVVARRDLRGWWQSKEELFDERVIAELLQADSQLSILFAGLDFSNDILGALEPGLQLVVAQPQFDASQPPELKLPAFALVGQLREPGAIKQRLRIAFQNVIGFANIQLAMEGLPQLDLMTETRDGVECSAATYLIDARSPPGLVQYNFSPALAFRDDWVILSSSKELAWQIARPGSASEQVSPEKNFSLQINGPALAEVLQLNRQLLEMQAMLQQGITRSEAAAQLPMWLDAIRWVERLEAGLEVHDDRLTWRVEVRFPQ